MKSIIAYCLGIFVPLVLFSQNPIQNQLILRQLEKPYLIVGNQNPFKEKIISSYKKYSKIMETYQGHTNAKLPIKQKLDSTILTPVDTTLTPQKSAYTYNNNGQITSSAEYAWDRNLKTWFYVSKIEWSYDASYKLTGIITYYGDTLKWYNELKYVNHYNNKNQIDTVFGYGWNDSTIQWDLGSKFGKTYDANGYLTSSITSVWNTVTNKWEFSDKYENQYDNNNFLSVTIYYEWQQPKWNFTQRDSFFYYFGGQIQEYFYDTWDGSGDWSKFSHSVFGYNNDLHILTVTDYLWDVISVIYVKSRKSDYKYDTGNSLTQVVFSKWVKQLQNFILEAKEDCTYDYNFLTADLVIPPNMKFSKSSHLIADNDIYFGHELTKFNYALHNGVTYVANNTRIFYWSPINITKTKDLNSNFNAQIVPNPVKDYFTVVSTDESALDFRLFDINGKQLISEKIHSNEPISAESLAKGIYIYKLFSNTNSLKSGKLIVN